MPGRRQRPASSFVAFRCIFLIACFEVVIERAFSLAAPIRGSFNRDQHSGTDTLDAGTFPGVPEFIKLRPADSMRGAKFGDRVRRGRRATLPRRRML